MSVDRPPIFAAAVTSYEGPLRYTDVPYIPYDDSSEQAGRGGVVPEGVPPEALGGPAPALNGSIRNV